MREGLLYMLFAAFALLLISSNQIRNKQLRNDIPSCQSITVNTNSACILPEFSFSLKKVFSESTFLKIIHKSLFEDALHIANATIRKADILVSWNFKHIVNIDRIRKYNAVNLMQGYSPIEIRTPREVLKEKDYEN
jgi:hypothetical protein